AEQATVHLDSDATELGRTFRPTVALNGDARATLEALTVRLRPHARRAWLAEAEKLRAQGRRDREALEESNAAPLQPPRVMRELASRLGDNDVVISDASFSAGWIAAHVPARTAG